MFDSLRSFCVVCLPASSSTNKPTNQPTNHPNHPTQPTHVDTNSTHHQQHSQQHQQQLQQHALLLQQHNHQQQQHGQQHVPQQYVAMDAGAVTLSNLKKQRSLSRTANVLNNFELSSTTSAASATTATTATSATTTNGSVLGAATTVNHNNNNNNNTSSANNNNNNMAAGPIAAQPLGLGAMSPSLLDFETAAPMATSGNANSVNKFCGNTGDVVSDSTSTSRKCCVLM